MSDFTPFWEEKVWGRVKHVFASPQASVSYLETKKNTRCSIHYHQERANQFIVIEGCIMVERFSDENLFSALDEHILTENCIYTVPCGVWHRFKALQDSRAIEVYFPGKEGGICRMDDIVRHDVGGVF